MYHKAFSMKGDNNFEREGMKDPYEVLGLKRDANQAEIKKAYRRLALKHHPDRVEGEEAKKQATATFAEVSAAYELLTKSESTGEGGPASRPPFSSNNPSVSVMRNYDGVRREEDLHPSCDPFGFGTFWVHFEDPFELFRRSFEGETLSMFPSPMNPIFPTSTMGMSLNAFPYLFGPNFTEECSSNDARVSSGNLVNGIASSYTSLYQFGGINGGTSKMISSTTTIINGKAVTRQEETIVDPDGTRSTCVIHTEDETTSQLPISSSSLLVGQMADGTSASAASNKITPPKKANGHAKAANTTSGKKGKISWQAEIGVLSKDSKSDKNSRPDERDHTIQTPPTLRHEVHALIHNDSPPLIINNQTEKRGLEGNNDIRSGESDSGNTSRYSGQKKKVV